MIHVTFCAALRFVAGIAENKLMVVVVIKKSKALGACSSELVITLGAGDCVELRWMDTYCVFANFAEVFGACWAEACCINAFCLVWLVRRFFSFRKVIGEFITTSFKDANGVFLF